MNHILEKINKQIKSGRAFNQSRNYSVLDRSHFPKYFWDLYPLAQDYYHELNPIFVGNLYKKELLRFTDVHTVRDGKISFANFLVTNVEHILASKSHFLIPEGYADLIPQNLKDQFSCWSLSLKNPKPISEAKRILIFGLLFERYYGSRTDLEDRIRRDFAGASKDAKIEVLLPIRQDVFLTAARESLEHFHVYDSIKAALNGRSFELIKLEHFFDRTIGPDEFLYDLKVDDSIVADSSLHYHYASKGAGVNLLGTEVPKDTFRSLSISFWHQLNIFPLKHKDSAKFAELLFYKRVNNRNLIQDKNFHALISE